MRVGEGEALLSAFLKPHIRWGSRGGLCLVDAVSQCLRSAQTPLIGHTGRFARPHRRVYKSGQAVHDSLAGGVGIGATSHVSAILRVNLMSLGGDHISAHPCGHGRRGVSSISFGVLRLHPNLIEDMRIRVPAQARQVPPSSPNSAVRPNRRWRLDTPIPMKRGPSFVGLALACSCTLLSRS